MPNSVTALPNFTSFAKTANASALQAFYEYHLVPGWVAYSSSLRNGMKLKTVQGSNITITVQDGEIFANAARVIATGYLVSNGVVHVLDK